MRLSEAVRGTRPLLTVAVVGATMAGLLGTTAVLANGLPDECAVAGSTLTEARALYENGCSLARADCDEIDDTWYCSSRVIGASAPAGVSSDHVGASAIGSDETVVIANPPTTTPPTTTPPTTTPPTTAAPTTAAPTSSPTTAPPTSPPTTTAPPTTVTSSPTTIPDDDPVALRRTYTKNAGPDRNPLKGWNSGWSDDRDESTVGFQYLKWSDLEPQNGVFDFDAVEEVMARSGSSGRHVILRLYCDWWGANERSRGCPDWIYSEVGVERIKGDNGRYITDYNDPKYLDEAVQAIEALAHRYDDDPRLFSFQLGILGYWGEWHTWGSQVDGDSYEITPQTETRILDAYVNSFDRTHLMARYPSRSILTTAAIGFHNDYFKPNNGHSAEFDEAISSGRRWMTGPVGGEAPPGLSSSDYQALYATPQGQQMIEKGHYSTMKPGSVTSQNLQRHLELHKRFGYNFQVDEATFDGAGPTGGEVDVELQLRNIGIAPFYYDWQVQLALLDDGGRPLSLSEADAYDLRDHLPGDAFVLAGNVPTNGVGSGRYRLAVRLVQPGADQEKAARWKLDARKTYVLFANDMAVVDGTWNDSNQLVGGWQILGTTEVG